MEMTESKYYIFKLNSTFRGKPHDFELSFPNQYKVVSIIGQGSFGFVLKVRNEQTNNYAAIKYLVDTLENAVLANRAYREISMLHLHNHPNLIRALNVYTPANDVESFKEVYIVTEFMDQTLKTLIESKSELSHKQIAFLVYQIFAGLNHLKKMGIVHRDVKPGNMLTNANCQLKIIDFGLAREQVDSTMTTPVATTQYRAPEIFLMPRYSYKSDMWSVGCIFVELFTKETLFHGIDSRDPWVQNYGLWKQIIDKFGRMPDGFWNKTKTSVPREFKKYSDKSRPGFKNLIKKNKFPPEEQPFTADSARELIGHMLVIDPDQRWSVEKALQHPYVHVFWNDSEINCEPKGRFEGLKFDKTDPVDVYKAPIYELIQKHHQDFNKMENTDNPQSTSSQNTQPETLFTASSVEDHKSYDKTTKTYVALKQLQIDNYLYDNMYAKYKLLLSDTHKHQNILQLQHYYTPQSSLSLFTEIYIVMDYMDTTLKDIINTGTKFQHQQLSLIIKQILSGLKHLEQLNIAYGNLRPEFILVNQKLELKLTDFGVLFNCADQEELLKVHGYEYISPEIVFHVNCDFKASVWSVGCIFIELVVKYPVFCGNQTITQWEKTVNLLGNAPPSFLNKLRENDREWIMERQNKFAPNFYDVLEIIESLATSNSPNLTAELALDLISKMLKIDSEDRYSVEDALNHMYLRSPRLERIEFPSISPADIAIIHDESSEAKQRLFDKVCKNPDDS